MEMGILEAFLEVEWLQNLPLHQLLLEDVTVSDYDGQLGN